MSSLLGIDLGTSRVKAAFISEDGRAVALQLSTDNFLPSVTYFHDNGTVEIGVEAFNLALVDPTNAVMHWKREIGSDKILYVDAMGKEYRARDIAKIMLAYVKDKAEGVLGRVIENAVVSVPANFTDNQKQEIITAAKFVGFSCVAFEDKQVRLVHEPTAAMYSQLAGSDKASIADGIRLVCDLGGGTTDISIAKAQGNKYDIIATSGIPKLGGLDYTKLIVDTVIEQFKKQTNMTFTQQECPDDYLAVYEKVEDAKIRLNSTQKATIVVSAFGQRASVTITKDEVACITKSLTEQVINCIDKTLKDSNLTREDIIECLPIGGGSQLFCVLESLERYFGRPLSKHSDPHLAVAKGCALMAWQEAGKVTTVNGLVLPCKQHSIHDVTAHALGIYAKDAINKTPLFAPILDKSIPMPSSFTRIFGVDEAGATDVNIRVLQGESGQAPDVCTELGSFDLRGIDPRFDASYRIEVELRIDKNGVLTAKAYDANGGRSADLQLQYQGIQA